MQNGWRCILSAWALPESPGFEPCCLVCLSVSAPRPAGLWHCAVCAGESGMRTRTTRAARRASAAATTTGVGTRKGRSQKARTPQSKTKKKTTTTTAAGGKKKKKMTVEEEEDHGFQYRKGSRPKRTAALSYDDVKTATAATPARKRRRAQKEQPESDSERENENGQQQQQQQQEEEEEEVVVEADAVEDGANDSGSSSTSNRNRRRTSRSVAASSSPHRKASGASAAAAAAAAGKRTAKAAASPSAGKRRSSTAAAVAAAAATAAAPAETAVSSSSSLSSKGATGGHTKLKYPSAAPLTRQFVQNALGASAGGVDADAAGRDGGLLARLPGVVQAVCEAEKQLLTAHFQENIASNKSYILQHLTGTLDSLVTAVHEELQEDSFDPTQHASLGEDGGEKEEDEEEEEEDGEGASVSVADTMFAEELTRDAQRRVSKLKERTAALVAEEKRCRVFLEDQRAMFEALRLPELGGAEDEEEDADGSEGPDPEAAAAVRSQAVQKEVDSALNAVQEQISRIRAVHTETAQAIDRAQATQGTLYKASEAYRLRNFLGAQTLSNPAEASSAAAMAAAAAAVARSGGHDDGTGVVSSVAPPPMNVPTQQLIRNIIS